jgi:REP-associated tyrosine transposase
MPRRARIRIPGLPLHIIQRGNNRAACFSCETDYRVYLSLLRDSALRFDCAIHAYVLMTNHVHLLMTPGSADGASRVMKHLGQQFVQYVNRSRHRTGSLWEGRFRSSIVDSEGYLLRCHRYIEMNPVRAGMVTHPGDYPWSSYRANAWGLASDMVTRHSRLTGLGHTDEQRRAAYLQLFNAALTTHELEEIRAAANGGFALGSPEFVEQLGEIAGRPAGRRRKGPKRLCSEAPASGVSGLSPN